jgi:hypothetical protein
VKLKKEKRNQILVWVLIIFAFNTPLLFSHFWLGLAFFLVASLIIVAGILLSSKNISS